MKQKPAKKREKENLSIKMKHKQTKQSSSKQKIHAGKKLSTHVGKSGKTRRLQETEQQLQTPAEKHEASDMVLTAGSSTLGAGRTGKGSKKRKRIREPQQESISNQISLQDDLSPQAPKKAKQQDDSQLSRKQWRNHMKMKKNSKKKNKYKHLAQNKSSDERDEARGTTHSSDGVNDKKDSAVFSVPQVSLSVEKDARSTKKGKSPQLNQLVASMNRTLPTVQKLAQKQDGLAPVSVTSPKKKTKAKNKAKTQKAKEFRKSGSLVVTSKPDTQDFSDSDSEESDSETYDSEDSNSPQSFRSSPSNGTTRTQDKDSQKETSSKKPKVVSALDKAQAKLNAARFRYLNEQLYTSTGEEALTMFQEDPEAFQVYHQGFQLQVSQWPVNPLDVILRQLAKLPKETVVADFGCGDAQLAASLPVKKVHSFDLVSTKPCITACDIAKVPLGNSSVDVAVFCLSLMGTNLSDYLCEANRVLRKGGSLKIAEVVSRFYSVSRFVKNVEALGFHLQKKTFLDKMFMMFTFKKVKDSSRKQAPRIELKACYYKRR